MVKRWLFDTYPKIQLIISRDCKSMFGVIFLLCGQWLNGGCMIYFQNFNEPSPHTAYPCLALYFLCGQVLNGGCLIL